MAFAPCKGILLTRMGRHYREIFTGVVRRIGSWRGRGGGGFRSDRGITGLCADSARADFFSL